MENLAFYSSNGRIRQMVILDRRSVEGDDESTILAGITSRYVDFIRDLNSSRIGAEVTVWVFYMSMKNIVIQGTRPDVTGFGKFIQDNEGINSTWAQDAFHVVKTREAVRILVNEVYVGGSVVKKMQDEIAVLGKDVSFVNFDLIPDGGDFVNIKGLCREYGIDGASLQNSDAICASGILGVRNYLMLNWKDAQVRLPGGGASRFFHLDLYMTFVGQDLGNKTNIILLPYFIYQKGKAPNVFAAIERQIEEFPSQLMELGFDEGISIIRIPLIRLGSGVLLTYNNCIVENYMLDEKRHIRVLFPDYGEKTKAVINATWDQAQEAGGSATEWNILQADINKAYGHFVGDTAWAAQRSEMFASSSPAKLLNIKAEVIIAKAEQLISDELTRWGIQVEFLDLSCDYFAPRQGSLHCLTKVIQRDCLP